MARRLFFVEEIRRERAEVRGEAARHLSQVLRVEPGQVYEISDNRSLYLAEVETAHKQLVSFRVVEALPPRPLEPEITLLAALVKFDHFEWMIEKATELGVARIVPVAADRSEKGLERAAVGRVERWRRIALEASQQCRRMTRPEVEAVMPFAAAIECAGDRRVMLDEQGGRPVLDAVRGLDPIVLLAGPEGGWTERERDAAVRRGWSGVSLGPLILRAETAVLAALAAIGAACRTKAEGTIRL